MARWYLVRHAKTPWNDQGRLQGQSGTSLEAGGVAQAQRLAQRLAPVPLHAVYSSDLARTMETARILVTKRSMPLVATPELREMAYGKWEGMTRKEIQATYPIEFSEYMKGDVSFIPPGGEGPLQLMSRLTPFVDRLSRAHGPQENILLVAHGGSLRALVVLLLGLPPHVFWRFPVGHASVSIVTTYPNTTTLDLWNDLAHLETPQA